MLANPLPLSSSRQKPSKLGLHVAKAILQLRPISEIPADANPHPDYIHPMLNHGLIFSRLRGKLRQRWAWEQLPLTESDMLFSVTMPRLR